MDSQPSLRHAIVGGHLSLDAEGAWTAVHANELERLVAQSAGQASQAGSVSINARGIEALDTCGAWILERLVRELHALGREARVVELPERYHGLTKEVQRVNRHVPPHGTRQSPVVLALESLGRSVVASALDLVRFANMLGALATTLGRVLVHPQRLRLISIVHQLDRVALQAVPIILLITFLIGCIIAQQAIFHFRKFGAEDYVVDMVGVLVLREIGVLIVAIMVAGRSGSSYTAELGSMKMREEIDALRTMGFDPVEILVLPRVIALVFGLPILTFLGSIAALYGGGLVAWLYGGMAPEIFMVRLKEAISITHFKVGMIKAPFMALAIGIVACSEGFQVKGSAESLGLQTTTSVVKSIFLVIVLDGIFAMFFASIGM